MIGRARRFGEWGQAWFTTGTGGAGEQHARTGVRHRRELLYCHSGTTLHGCIRWKHERRKGRLASFHLLFSYSTRHQKRGVASAMRQSSDHPICCVADRVLYCSRWRSGSRSSCRKLINFTEDRGSYSQREEQAPDAPKGIYVGIHVEESRLQCHVFLLVFATFALDQEQRGFPTSHSGFAVAGLLRKLNSIGSTIGANSQPSQLTTACFLTSAFARCCAADDDLIAPPRPRYKDSYS